MVVLRCNPNIACPNPAETKAFYQDVLDMHIAMDMNWIITFASTEKAGTATPQITVASQGGSDTPVPDISVEVDDVDATYKRAQDAGSPITYPITNEPWGVRRFYVKDPAGKLLNIMQHLK